MRPDLALGVCITVVKGNVSVIQSPFGSSSIVAPWDRVSQPQLLFEVPRMHLVLSSATRHAPAAVVAMDGLLLLFGMDFCCFLECSFVAFGMFFC